MSIGGHVPTCPQSVRPQWRNSVDTIITNKQHYSGCATNA